MNLIFCLNRNDALQGGAHAPSRAVVGAPADHTKVEDVPLCGNSLLSDPTGGGAGRNTRGARVLPICHSLRHFVCRVIARGVRGHAEGGRSLGAGGCENGETSLST